MPHRLESGSMTGASWRVKWLDRYKSRSPRGLIFEGEVQEAGEGDLRAQLAQK